MLTALKILQTLLGMVFAFYIFKGLLWKMTDRDWQIAFAVMMAVFVIAFVRSQISFGG
jgi:uncharacterized membrane protein YgaE (UPF0421/DUF939 family)